MTAQASTLPWTFRLSETTRAPLPLVALGAAVAYISIFLLLHNAAGAMDGLQMQGCPLWLHPFGWAALVYVPLSGFFVVVGGYTLRAASANLRDLRLPGLLAYEARVERVREWPFDLPVLLRFGLYVLILLGSWVAGALVERALGLALD
jgi:hypothetical protein